MTDQGGRGGSWRDDDPRRRIPRSGDPRDAGGDFVLGRDGKPLIDRYGRPVRRRAAEPRAARPEPRQRPPRRDQQVPPRQTPPANETRYYPREQQPPRPRPVQQPAPQPMPQRRPAQPTYRRADDELLLSQSPEDRMSRRAPKPPRAPRRRRPGCLGCLGWPLALLLVLVVVVTLWADTRLTRVEAMPDQQIGNTAGTNWLLVGSDSRLGLSDADVERLGTGGDIGTGRTDTIMVLHIPTGPGASQLVSIPRDSLVSIPGYGEDKINAAFTFGGPQLLTETVEQSTGLHIDHYAEIGMGGLANLVDSVGGVQICAAEPIQDPLANLDIQAGCQEMDGPTALGYVRTRATAMGDIDRVMRQREFFAALLGEITAPATLLNPVRIVSLIYHGSGTFTVGKGEHVWHLARLALAMRGVETNTVPISGFLDTDVGNVVVWDETAAEELFGSMR